MIVVDSGDRSGMGMYSKAGRFTSEKYSIFKKKDEILNNKRRFKNVTLIPFFDTKELLAKEKSATNNSPTKNKKVFLNVKVKKKDVIIKKKKCPFDNMLTRKKRDEIYTTKFIAPPPGLYNPRMMPKKIKNVRSYQKELHLENPPTFLSHSQSSKITTTQDNQISERDFFKTSSFDFKNKTGVLFHQQIGRKSLDSSKNDSDEKGKRFEFFEIPNISTKNKRLSNIKLDKYIARKPFGYNLGAKYMPDYNPNYMFGKKKISNEIDFDKYSGRNIKKSEKDFFSSDLFSRTSEDVTRKKVISPLFSNYLDREIDSKSPLPSFMQKHINTRTSVTQLTMKMIEVNHYSSGQFQTMVSGFQPKKESPLLKKKKKNLSDFLDDSLLENQSKKSNRITKQVLHRSWKIIK